MSIRKENKETNTISYILFNAHLLLEQIWKFITKEGSSPTRRTTNLSGGRYKWQK